MKTRTRLRFENLAADLSKARPAKSKHWSKRRRACSRWSTQTWNARCGIFRLSAVTIRAHFTLVPFGGAGGLHAVELARALQIPRVLLPFAPGALSAIGVLAADVVKEQSRTVMWEAGPDVSEETRSSVPRNGS